MTRIVVGSVLCGVVLCVANPLSAQESETIASVKPAQPDGESISAITLDQLEAALKAVDSDEQLDDAVQASLRVKYQQAIDELRQAERFESQASEYRQSLETAPGRTEELRSQGQALPVAGSDEEVPPDASTEELQRELDLKRIKLGELADDLARSSKELSEFSSRPAEISFRIPQIERELTKLRKSLSSPELSPEVTSLGRVAERMLLQAQQVRLMREREKLNQELISLTVREELFEAERELLKRQVEIAVAAVKDLSGSLQNMLNKQAEEIRSRVDSLTRDLPADNQAAQELLAEVQELTREFEAVVGLQQNLQDNQSRISNRSQALEEQYARLQQLRGLNSRGTSTVQVLHHLQRRALRAPLDVQTTELPTLDEMQLASIQNRQKLAEQPVIEETFAESSSEVIGQLVSLRWELLEKIKQQYGTKLLALAKLKQTKREYLDRAAEVRSDISAQLLGFEIRSSPPLSAESLIELPQGLAWMFQRDHWLACGTALVACGKDQPVRSLGLLLMIAGLFLGRRWIKQAMVRCGTNVGKISKDRFTDTLQAVFWTLLLAIPLPLLLVFAFRVTLYATETSDWMLGLSEGLWRAANIASIATVMAAICHPGGLGAVHFRWSDRLLVPLRNMIRRLTVVYLTAIVLTSLCAVGESSQYFGSVGLVSFLMAHLWAVFVIWHVSRAVDWSAESATENARKHHTAPWRLGRFFLQLCLIALIVVACLGYLLTAFQLSQGLVWTVARVTGGIALYFLTLRWFSIRQRRLMLAEAVARRRARLEAAERGVQEESDEIVSVDLEDQRGMDLDVVSDQLQTLLSLLFGLGVAVSVMFFWTEIYPLDDVLNSIPVPLGESLTLLGLVRATLIIVLTVILVRILPRLLELSVLRASKTDVGTRNAIYTLGQYAVMLVAFVMVANALNLDWAKLSWIAAGLSVGLGFGLQEVVANFVCGLILLFERPIRVGDVVTVDGTTGTVTRINIRSTTITNWDRQDFVVPNKNLITGTILNWTLTASINRIAVSVGVAYGTDIEKAQQVLLEVANDHPRILDDPAPMVSCDRFGDSAINLVLFVYLPDLEYRIKTTTEMHTEIHNRFAAENIIIPFPQRDIHIRQGAESYPSDEKNEIQARQSDEDVPRVPR